MSHVGEIIASSTIGFTAQCPSDEAAPPLGGFVTVESPAGPALAVVFMVRAASFDANRRPMAYGLAEDDLYRQQPQLRELLATEFDAALVGHDPGSGWRQLLPPQPPRLHRFVYPADPAAIRSVTTGGDYLRTLAAAELSDDLLAAAIRASLAADDDQGAARVAMGQALARLLGDDYDRLQALLRRICA